MWRRGLKEVNDRKGKRSKVVRTIGPCEGCPAMMHDAFGCGYNEHKGKARRSFVHVDDTYPDDVKRTCPEYYARQPAVLEAYEYVGDYRKGNLGNVLRLSAPLLEALRVLDAEFDAFEAHVMEQ